MKNMAVSRVSWFILVSLKICDRTLIWSFSIIFCPSSSKSAHKWPPEYHSSYWYQKLWIADWILVVFIMFTCYLLPLFYRGELKLHWEWPIFSQCQFDSNIITVILIIFSIFACQPFTSPSLVVLMVHGVSGILLMISVPL